MYLTQWPSGVGTVAAVAALATTGLSNLLDERGSIQASHGKIVSRGTGARFWISLAQKLNELPAAQQAFQTRNFLPTPLYHGSPPKKGILA